MSIEFAVVVRVPAVAADQHAQAPGRGVDDIEPVFAVGLDRLLLFEHRIHLALGLADGQAIAAEHHAAVEQRATADFQRAVDDTGFGQHDGAGHQGDVKLLGQSAEQRLVILGHAFGFHAQVRVVDTALALGANQRADELQRVAHGSQFMASLNVPAWYNSSFSPLTISQVPTCSGNTTMVFSFNSPWSRAFCK
ncbi:hypothetical protein D9M71_500390 [compost metagenome]